MTSYRRDMRQPVDEEDSPTMFLPNTATDVFCSGPHSQRIQVVDYSLFGELGTIETWPASMPDTLCWHCCHPFDTVPASIPMHRTENRVWAMKGVFCGFECAKRYVLDMRLHNSAAVLFQLKRIASDFGVVDPIRSAPPRAMLRSFGGTMSLDEFRGCNQVLYTVETPFYRYGMGFVRNEKINTSIRGLRRPSAARTKSVRAPRKDLNGQFNTFLSTDTSSPPQAKKRKKQGTIKGGGMGAFLKKRK
jgi:hypothetical protein